LPGDVCGVESESSEIDSEFCDIEKLIADASGYPGNAGATKDNIRALQYHNFGVRKHNSNSK
jgi:hypothetical protein